MVMPGFQELMLPALTILKDGQPRKWRSLVRPLAHEFQLSEDELTETIPSGQTRFGNRLQWALSHLYQAGLVVRPSRGVVATSSQGQELLQSPPDRLDVAFLSRYPSYQEFRKRKKPAAATGSMATGGGAEESPIELIQQAVDANRVTVEAELLEHIRDHEPAQFERLVLRLLSAMGYGRGGEIEHSGQSGDGGIDGIISQDPLGLDRVYMQAKRYGEANAVGRPAVQAFVGALHGVQADRGVFLTTSTFTAGHATMRTR